MRALTDELTLACVERRHILAVLYAVNGNRTAAAKVLAISVRCLRNKLREYRTAGFAVPDHLPPMNVTGGGQYREVAELLNAWSYARPTRVLETT